MKQVFWYKFGLVLPKSHYRLVLNNTKDLLFSIQNSSETSLTKETVSHIYDLPHEFFSGCVVQLWWGTDAADAPCSEVAFSGYGRGVYQPLTFICVG